MQEIELLNQILDYFDGLEYVAYLLVFFFAASESTIGLSMLVPGSLIVMTLGALSAMGSFKIQYILLLAILGAVLGDNISYFLGKTFGRKLLSKLKFINSDTIDLAERFIQKHGSKSVALGRFVPFVKETVPFVAGTLGMPRRKFMIFNFLGALGWAALWPGMGYLFAKSVLAGNSFLGKIQLILMLSVFSYLLYLLIRESLYSNYNQGLKDNIKVLNSLLRNKVWRRVLLTIISAYSFFTFLAIAVQESWPIIHYLDNFGFKLYSYFNSVLFYFFKLITWTAKWYVVLAVLSVFAIYALLKKSYLKQLLSLAVAFFASAGAVHFLKHAFARPRPHYERIMVDGYSFPSGHAAVSTALGLLLSFLVYKSNLKHKEKIIFAIITWVFVIYMSRIYLGVHYMSDILGGVAVGLVFALLGISVWYYMDNKTKGAHSEAARSTAGTVNPNNKIPMSMNLKSKAFKDSEFIPSKYTCDGENINPPLEWTGIPEGTKSFALIVDDPDVPAEIRSDRHFTHWLLYNISAGINKIDENSAPGTQGRNDSGQNSYTGPCPPTQFEPTEHRYFFKLYALSETLDLPEGLSQAELEEAIKNYVLSEAVLMGRYDRAK